MRRVFNLIIFSVAAFMQNFAFAKNVAVTAVKADEKSAEITLNDAIVIRDIQVNREEGISLKFPEYVSKRGRISPQVKILTQEADETIRKSIQTGKAQGKPEVWQADKDAKITEFRRFTTDDGFFYIVEVTFGDAVALSCTIRKSAKGVRVGWPYRRVESESARRRFVNQVDFLNKGFRDTVEKMLLSRYDSEEKKIKQTDQKKPTKDKASKKKLLEEDE